jgi:hypothetical protein
MELVIPIDSPEDIEVESAPRFGELERHAGSGIWFITFVLEGAREHSDHSSACADREDRKSAYLRNRRLSPRIRVNGAGEVLMDLNHYLDAAD